MRGVNKIYYNMCVEAKTDDPNEIDMLYKIKLVKWSRAFLVDDKSTAQTIDRLK